MGMTSRLLGLAFAAADLLLELDGDGRVQFAIGAGPRPGLDPASAWDKTPLVDQIAPAERHKLRRLLAELQPGQRSPSIDLLFATGEGQGRRARFHAFRLPELGGTISCALAWDGELETLVETSPQGMLGTDALLDRTRDLLTGPTPAAVAIDFVDLPGLSRPDDGHRRAAASIEALLQLASFDGASAARLTPERFAVVRDSHDQSDLAGDIRSAGAAEGVSLDVEIARALPDPGIAAGMTIRALRLALENCLKDGVTAAGAGFAESLNETVRGAERFRAVVRARDFSLKYQPIVDLKTRDVHHFEALTRFTGTSGPAETIHMAEELGLIEGFDLVVAEKAVVQLKRPGRGQTCIAVNVSAASLAGDAYVDHLLRQTATTPDLRKRLMVEVTETAALADLDGADRRLRALRDAGIRICLDDFGAGAASFDYLGRLSLDTVKIDGHFMRDIADNARSRTLIGHLVKLCGDLHLSTVAEMVETEGQADAVKALGVGFGQGWLFGRPQDEPVVAAPAPQVQPAVRRRGEVEAWG